MGRICGHRSRDRPQKTYSRAPSCYNKNVKSQTSKSVRKPLPRFEDLFLQKDKSEVYSQFTLTKTQDTLKWKRSKPMSNSDSSNDINKSLSDTFDAIASMKIDEQSNFTKKNKGYENPIFTSSESSETDSFQSVFNAALFHEEMFVASPFKTGKQTKASSNLSEFQLAGCKSNKQKQNDPPKLLKDNQNLNLKEKDILVPTHSLKIMTSTPNMGRAEEPKTQKNGILENELSPVNRETSVVLEMSSASESDNFFSCLVNSFGRNVNLTKSGNYTTLNQATNTIDNLLQNKLKDCCVSLSRLDPVLESLPSSDSDCDSELCTDSFGASSEKRDKIGHFQNLKSTGGSIHRVTRRKRICPPPFDIRDKIEKKILFGVSQSGLKDFSSFDVSRYKWSFGKKPSLMNNKRFNSSDGSNQSSLSSMHSLTAFKSGKGWRRTAKKISVKKLQSSSTSHITGLPINSRMPERLKEASTESLNRSSVLQFDPLESEEEEDPRKFVLQMCCQEEVVSISLCLKKRAENCKKIGEGVYGEVFMYYDDSTTIPFAENRVVKVIPIEEDFMVNGEPQKTFKEIAAEIAVSKALSDLRNGLSDNITSSFVRVHRSWCVKGSYPQKFLDLWDAYAESKGSENDRPYIFPDRQLYIILEFEFAGQDLESYVFNNALQAYFSFLQVAYALAVAEERLEFEHRDLHWGNILIRQTSESFIHYTIRKNPIKLKSHGVRATVIDFTLSRLRVDGRVFFNDLATDPSMFTAEGDYQFDIYRNMQTLNGNNWREFNPVTNIFWLHYLSLKLINDCYYKNTATLIHNEGMKKLKNISDSILTYTSAFKLTCDLQNLTIGST